MHRMAGPFLQKWFVCVGPPSYRSCSVALQFIVKAWPMEDHWGIKAAQENLLSAGQWEEEKGTCMRGNTLTKKAERQSCALSMELT